MRFSNLLGALAIALVPAFVSPFLPNASVAQEATKLTIASLENKYPNMVAIVSAVDGAGNPLANLDRSSFSVDEEGSPAEIVDFRPTNDILNVVVALDTSGSMAFGPAGGRGIDGARNAIITFLQQLKDGDNVALLTFDNAVRLRSDFTYDKGLVRNLLVQLEPPNGATALYRAVVDAADLARRAPAGRKLLLLLTDGSNEPVGDPGPSLDDAISAAQGAELTVYTIGFGTETKPEILSQIAAATRGKSQIAPTPTELTDLVLRTHRQLTQQWAIQYRSKSPPGEHSVTVSLKDGSARDSRTFSAPGIPPKIEVPRTVTVKGASILSYQRVTLQSDRMQLKRVEYFLDNASQPAFTSTESPWSWTWDSTGLESGSHVVKLKVTDSAGQVAESDPIDVRVERAAAIMYLIPAGLPAIGGRWLLLEVWHVLLVGSIAAVMLLALSLLSLRRPKMVPINVVEAAAPLERTDDIGVVQKTADIASAPQAYVTMQLMKGEIDQVNREFDVRPPVVLGRDPAVCGILIHDSKNLVSRSHAEIRMEQGDYVLYDRNSKYHTYVNGKQVTGSAGHILKNNDVVNLGPAVILRFKNLSTQLGFDDPGESTGAVLNHPDERTEDLPRRS